MYSPKAFTAFTAATLWLAAATANAAPFASDDFSYPNGNLAGSTGGIGWAGAWANAGGVQATVATGSATFTYTGNPGSENFRVLTATIGAGTTTWIRFDGKMTSNTPTGDSYGGLGLYEGGTERLLIGKDWPGTEEWKLSARDSSGGRTYINSTVSISNPGFDDIWLKIVNGGGNNDDSITLWINPSNTSSEVALGTALGTLTGRNLNFNTVRLRGGTGGGNSETWTFDNLKLGSAFEDMSSPAPRFSLESGTYYGATTVTVTWTPGSTIYYTTDNTEPTTASPAGIAGSGAATVLLDTRGTVTLRVLGVLGGQNSLSEATYVIIIGDGVWVDDIGGSWTDDTNWVDANIAFGANRTASFPALLTADATVTLNSDMTIGNLLFGGGGAPDARWIIAGSKTLTLSGTSPAINTAADTAAAITCKISGSDGLTKGGEGILSLTSTGNTYTGGTTVNDGILELGGADNSQSRVGSGPLTINAGAEVHAIGPNPLGWNTLPAADPEVVIQGGTFDSRTYASSFRKLTMNGGILTRSASHWYTGQAANEIHATGGEPLVSGGEFRLRPAIGATDLPVMVDEDTTLTISSTLANDNYGPSGIVKSGAGTLALSGNNTYGSNTRVTGGTLVVIGSLAYATKIQVEPGAVLELAANGVLYLNPARSVQVDGEAALSGIFDINLAAVSPVNGGEWIIVEAAQGAVVTYAEGFSVAGFDPSGSGSQRVWNRSTPGWQWTFSQETGVLSVAAADGYASWALANGVTGGMADDDDNDGVDNGIEFFMGDTSSGFTAMPVPDANRKITWPKGAEYNGVYGTGWLIETSSTLQAGSWNPVAEGEVQPAVGSVSYTLPANLGKIFVRLKVMGPQ